MPVYDMIEHAMLRHNVKINFPIRFFYRTLYVVFTTFIAITLVRDLPCSYISKPGTLPLGRAPPVCILFRASLPVAYECLIALLPVTGFDLSITQLAELRIWLVGWCSPSSATCWGLLAPSRRGRPPSGCRRSCGSC